MSIYKKYAQKHRDLMFQALDYIWKNPETGYREWKTHEYMKNAFEALGYELTLAGNIPGFTTEIDTGKPGPTLAIFGEMDALICASHPDADPETKAVHSCGHCGQAAALIGLAAALKEEGVLDGLWGKIRLIAVPAEELIEVEYREELYRQGIIKYFGGKPEFMRRGLLDGVDLAFIVHINSDKEPSFRLNRGSNGCIAKSLTFEGVAAHAGARPHQGVNALYAANLALNAANALRETFQDSHHIRFHPIITNGGDVVNAIPDKVTVESFVRGANAEEIAKANRRINRAMAASAAAMGAKLHVRDIPGYWTRIHSKEFSDAFLEAAKEVTPYAKVTEDWGNACSDMGDVAAVMPAIHPSISGATGTLHGNDFRFTDPEMACVVSVEGQLALLALLLKDEGKRAKEIVAAYKPHFASMEEYFAYVDALNVDADVVSYEGDGKVVITY